MPLLRTPRASVITDSSDACGIRPVSVLPLTTRLKKFLECGRIFTLKCEDNFSNPQVHSFNFCGIPQPHLDHTCF